MSKVRETPPLSATLWLQIAVRGNVVVGAVAAATAVAAACIAGGSAFGGVLVAWALVAGCLSISMLVVGYAWKRAPTLAMPLLVGAFIVKTVVLGLFLVQETPGFPYDEYWLACSAVAFVMLWQVSEVAVIIKKWP